jgi:hypothetical protein
MRAHVIIVVLSVVVAGTFWLVNKRQLRSKNGLLWLRALAEELALPGCAVDSGGEATNRTDGAPAA